DDLGRYNSVYPNCDGKRDIPDFTINMPEWVLRYYMATGDRELLETAYPYLKETGNYITRNISSNTGLVTMLAGKIIRCSESNKIAFCFCSAKGKLSDTKDRNP
ncbi:alpha-L-rhamnosidase domain protein, partial [human gut metagenome]